jgi:CBS domain containing-hemolysin-like protein
MGLRLLLLILIVGTNGFFAAAEVALVSVRQSRLHELAAQGNKGAQSALSLLANPGRLLSVTQFGVTLASLGLGWAGEQTLYSLFRGLFDSIALRIPNSVSHGIAFTFAFLVISYGHVIAGEVVPKNLALEKADRLAVLVAPALLVFYRLSQPFVFVIEATSALLLRAIGLSTGHARGGHTPEELKYIIQAIRHEGRLEQFEEDAIRRLIDLSNYSAREIMTPRHNIVSLPIDADLETVVERLAEYQFTRIPVWEGRPEHIIGIIHYKDVMRVWEERRFGEGRRRPATPFRLRRLLRKPVVVPETKPLNQLIDEFRKCHARLALVVDEFGTVAGLVTLHDVLQQVFGDISDEHDIATPASEPHEQVIEVEGSTTIRALETRYGITLPSDAGFETLAGFLLAQLGFIPKGNESVVYDGRRFTITRVNHNRISSVAIEKLDHGAQNSQRSVNQ